MTNLVTEDDSMFVTLTGTATTENSAVAVTQINLPFSYLSSRSHLDDDTNRESSDSPARFSIMNDMLMSGSLAHTTKDDLINEARDTQDNPPYDVFAVDDVNNDVTEPVELCRIVSGLGSSLHASAIIDVPFGIMSMKASHFDAADTNTTHGIMVAIEVLDIYEMQG